MQQFRDRTYFATIEDATEGTKEDRTLTFAEVADRYPDLAPLCASLRPDDDFYLRISSGEMVLTITA